MPFTFAHPAIILPLTKRSHFFSSTALIIGSMVPDLEFIAQLQRGSSWSHHTPGIFLFNIPFGLFLCWFFHSYLKYALIQNLPLYFRSRFQFCLELNWSSYFRKNFLKIFVSLLIGIASHLAWDAFTHSNGVFVELWPSLAAEVFFLDRVMPIYHMLQIISSLLGLFILAYAVVKLPSTSLKEENASKTYWYSFGAIFVLIVIVRFGLIQFNNGFWDVVLGIMGISMYSLFINSLFHSFWLRKPMMPEP